MELAKADSYRTGEWRSSLNQGSIYTCVKEEGGLLRILYVTTIGSTHHSTEINLTRADDAREIGLTVKDGIRFHGTIKPGQISSDAQWNKPPFQFDMERSNRRIPRYHRLDVAATQWAIDSANGAMFYLATGTLPPVSST